MWFVLVETALLLILSLLLGVFIGWLTWGKARRSPKPPTKALKRMERRRRREQQRGAVKVDLTNVGSPGLQNAKIPPRGGALVTMGPSGGLPSRADKTDV